MNIFLNGELINFAVIYEALTHNYGKSDINANAVRCEQKEVCVIC